MKKSEMLSWRNEKPSYIRYWGGLDILGLQHAKNFFIKRTSDVKIRMHNFEIIKHLHDKDGADQSAAAFYLCMSSTWILRLDCVQL